MLYKLLQFWKGNKWRVLDMLNSKYIDNSKLQQQNLYLLNN